MIITCELNSAALIQFIFEVNLQMGGIIAQGICCCFACCCQELSDAMRRLLGSERVTKIFYLILVAIFSVPAIIIFFFLHRWEAFVTYFSSILTCPSASSSNTDPYECIGSSAVFRISLSILSLFFIMMLIMVCRNRVAMVINEGLFCIKYMFVLALFIAFLFVNNDVFNSYSQASMYISIIFMILQSIILIDLFYLAGIKLVKRYDEGETGCACVLVILSLVFEAGAILCNILGYVYFSTTDGCGNSLWVNIIATIIIVLLPLLQLLNFNKQNSLLTTAMVSAYISYLAFICQYSYGPGSSQLPSQCSRMTTPSLVADILVSTFFFVLTMYGSIMGGTGQVKITANGDINKAIGVAAPPPETEQLKNEPVVKDEIKKESDEVVNEERYTNSWDWVKWHFYMCLASIYIGMLITNWNSASIITGQLQSNDFGFWVRVVISWTTTLLYIWTLIAPRVFPERDFEVV